MYKQLVGYDGVIRLTRMVTGDVRDIQEFVRRAVFNVVAHNRDDHARNIAYLWSPTNPASASLPQRLDLPGRLAPCSLGRTFVASPSPRTATSSQRCQRSMVR